MIDRRVPTSSSAHWLELPEASRRSGKSLGHLRRLCRTEWAARGLAREIEGGGKRSRWIVAEEADASLARVKFPEQIGADLRSFPDNKRREAVRRKKILDGWRKAIEGAFRMGFVEMQATAQFLSHLEAETGEKVCRATLFNWERKWRAGGLAALIDLRGGRGDAGTRGRGEAGPFLEEIKRLYLSVRKLKLTVCHEIASLKAAENGWEPKYYKACQRFIDSLPKAVILKYRHGEEAFVNEAEPFIERDYSTLRSNELWCSDHHQVDVIVNAGGQGGLVRPWLTAWQDLRSRKIVAFRVFAHDPNSDPILSCFREAVLAEGVPESVYVDNGKDFDCYALNGRTKKDRWLKRRVRFELDAERTGVFPSLDIQVIHAWPFHGQSKPIERWFGTVELQTPVWPTYCGRSTAEKPEDLQLQLERGKAPPLAEFSEWFAQVVQNYNASAHTGDSMDGQSPNQIFAENLTRKRTTTAEAMDVYCLRITPPVKVGQNGVTYKGLRYGQYDLHLLIGQEVVLRVNDADLSSVQAWSLDGKFLALAKANVRVPMNATSQELREAINQKKQFRKTLRSYIDQRPRMHEDLPDLLLRAKTRRHEGTEARSEECGTAALGCGPSIMPVRTAIDDSLPALRRALEAESLRPAVGAESMSTLSSVRGFLREAPDSFPDPMAELRRAMKGEL